MKYAIAREFGIYRRLKVPLNRFVLKAAKWALTVCPKGMRSSKDLAIEKEKVGGGKVRLYLVKPKTSKILPVVFYLHGGGFVFKGAPYHYRLAKEYALQCGVAVAFVDYRLAFEEPAGTTFGDCEAAYRHLTEHAEALGVDKSRVCFAGDSAGAYLCLALAACCRREGLPLPDGLMLVYPVVDPKMSSPTVKMFPDTPMWNAKCNEKMWKIYSGGREEFDPLCADLSFFPPAYIETAEFDCLRGEGEALFRKLTEAGIPCVLNETEKTMHGFDIRGRSAIARRAIGRRIAFLKELFWERT